MLRQSYLVVIVTTANRKEAEKIARCLLDKRLIACANIAGPVSSLFWWSGKVEEADEHVLLMKSHIGLFNKLCETVKTLHSYEVPEIVALPIIEGSSNYLNWLDSSLKQADESIANRNRVVR